jgi:hypothetical protein
MMKTVMKEFSSTKLNTLAANQSLLANLRKSDFENIAGMEVNQ